MAKKMSTIKKVAIGAGGLSAVLYGIFKMSCSHEGSKECSEGFFTFYNARISELTSGNKQKTPATTPQMQTTSTSSSNSSAMSKF